MKMKFVSDFDAKRLKNYEVDVDRVLFDEGFAGGFKVRVRDWKRPKWLAITWFVDVPDDRYIQVITC